MKLFLLAGLVVCMNIAYGQAPAWYSTHTHHDYQPEFYIIGVGAADGTDAVEKAKKNAQADIVSQIRVQVKNEIKTITESYQLNQDETISSEFKSQSRTVVNDELAGAVIVETYVDPSTQTAYALAALDRERYCDGLRGEMNSAWHQASDLGTAADDFLTRGKFSDAIHSVADARGLIVSVLPKKALHDAVAGKTYTPPNAWTPLSLTTAMQTMISKVRIEKLHGDRQSGKIGTVFADKFEVRVFYEATPVAGAALIFESTDFMALGEGQTDAEGDAVFTAHVRMLPGNTLRARMLLGDLSKEFERNLLSVAAVFSYTPHTSDVGFEIAAKGMQGASSDALRSRVSAAVAKIGYRVVPASRFALELTLHSTPPVKTEGFSGTLNTVKVEATVTLIDKHSGATLGTYAASAMGGGRTEEDAVAKAASSVTPEPMKLADLLEKIQQ